MIAKREQNMPPRYRAKNQGGNCRDEQIHGSVQSPRFFTGLSITETAQALEVSEATVQQDWRTARAILFARMEDERGAGSGRPV